MNAFLRNVMWDLRALRRSRVALLGVCIILCACGLAMKQGLLVANAWQEQASMAQTEATKSMDAVRKKPPQGVEAVATTLFMQRPVLVLPPAPLVELATGRSDLDPRTGKAGTFLQQNVLFKSYQIEGPIQVALGKFDLVFVIQWLFPLVILGLGYGLLTEDRHRGIDRLLLVQGTCMWRLALARLFSRSLITILPMLAVLGVFACLNMSGVAEAAQRPQRLLWATALIMAYLGFWWALVLWVNAWGLGQTQTLMVLVLIWVLTALVLPGLAGVVSRNLHPAPSRHAFIAESRAQEINATKQGKQLMGDYAHDHPELDEERANALPWWVGIHLISKKVDAALEPSTQAFTTALEQQQAAVRAWRFVSPSLMLQQGLTTLAGTDETRFAAFRHQAKTFQEQYRNATGEQMIVAQSLDADRFEQLARFKFKEPSIDEARTHALLSTVLLGSLALMLLLHAILRLRKQASG